MSFPATAHVPDFLFAGYVLCSVALNVIALLISIFYRKKFQHASPRWGFLAAIVLSLLYCVSLAAGAERFALLHAAALFALASGALTSVISTVNLFLIMQRVRK